MADENGSGTAEKLKTEEAGKRQRSSIAFPYMDLAEAIALAEKTVDVGLRRAGLPDE